jgi:hypothetical protein
MPRAPSFHDGNNEAVAPTQTRAASPTNHLCPMSNLGDRTAPMPRITAKRRRETSPRSGETAQCQLGRRQSDGGRVDDVAVPESRESSFEPSLVQNDVAGAVEVQVQAAIDKQEQVARAYIPGLLSERRLRLFRSSRTCARATA